MERTNDNTAMTKNAEDAFGVSTNDVSNKMNSKKIGIAASRTIEESKHTIPVHELGRHARERLQAERLKRREIQRIDFDDIIDNTNLLLPITKDAKVTIPNLIDSEVNNNSALIDAANVKVAEKLKRKKSAQLSSTNSTRITKKRPRRSISKSNDRNSIDQLIDRWIPNVSHLNTTDDRTTSDTIQLHGLPKQVTIQSIRSFFTGLDTIQRIVLLLPPILSNTSNEYIQLIDFDAKYDDSYKNNDQRIERCHPSYSGLRVLVQFTSVASAMLAVQRSGEIIYINTAMSVSQHERDEESIIGASIAITYVEQSIATHLMRVVGINITTPRQINVAVKDDSMIQQQQTQQSIEEILESVVSQADPNISIVLWNQLIDELSLNIVTVGTQQPHKSHYNATASKQTTTSIANVIKVMKKYRSFINTIPFSQQQINQLQQQKQLLQEEIDHFSTAINYDNQNIIRQDDTDSDTGWMMVPFFYSSYCDTTNNSYNDNNYKLQGMKDVYVGSSNNCFRNANTDSSCPVVLYFLDQYIRQLQIMIQKIDTMITIGQRWKIINNFKTNHAQEI